MSRLVFLPIAALAIASVANAHTLDEYFQALRIGVTPSQLTVFLDLTPGANIASDVARRIDANSDGVFSPEEAEAYGRAVLADVTATLDGAQLTLSLTRVEVPTVGDMRTGQSVTRIEAVAATATSHGRHRLVVRNSHLPSFSVYLANALMPETKDVAINRQTRDARQQTFWLDYEIRHAKASASAMTWLLAAGIGVTLHIRLRRTVG